MTEHILKHLFDKDIVLNTCRYFQSMFASMFDIESIVETTSKIVGSHFVKCNAQSIRRSVQNLKLSFRANEELLSQHLQYHALRPTFR